MFIHRKLLLFAFTIASPSIRSMDMDDTELRRLFPSMFLSGQRPGARFISSEEVRESRRKNHEYYKNHIDERIRKGMTGEALARRINQDPVKLPRRLIYQNFPDLLELILKHGVDADSPLLEFDEDSLLNTAVSYRDPVVCELLVAQGADVNRKTRSRTPLHTVVERDHRNWSAESLRFETRETGPLVTIGIARFLLRHNANPNLEDEYSMTPLFKLVSAFKDWRLDHYSTFQIARLLTIGGTSIKRKTDSNILGPKRNHKTVLEFALLKKKHKLAGFIGTLAFMRDKLFHDIAVGNPRLYGSFGENLKDVRDMHGNSVLYYALNRLQHSANQEFARKLILTWPHLLMQPNFHGKSIADNPELRARAEQLVN